MDEPPQPARRFAVSGALRALRHRNYKLFISGQIVSLTGSWIQSTAQGWLVYNVLTQNSFYLGLFNFASQIPVLALGLFAGAVADTYSRHKLLIGTQGLFMVLAILLTILTLMHGPDGMPFINLTSVMLLAVAAGMLQAFDLPARQAFLLEMVPPEDLQNAIALNSLTFNMARILGPAIAGGLVWYFDAYYPSRVAFGEGMCFLLNTLTYFAVLTSLLRMKVPPPAPRPPRGSTQDYLADGIRYVTGHIHVRALMTHLAVMAFFGIPYLMIIPVYAREVVHGDAATFGVLMASVGVGAVAGGVIMAMRKSVKGLGSYMVRSVFGFITFIILLAINHNEFVAMGLLAVAGFFMVQAMIGSQTLTQTLVPEHLRGRVMSIYSMISVGMLPFGSLISGAMAEEFGVPAALIINSVAVGLATVYFAFKLPQLRQSALQTAEYRNAIGLK